MRSNRLVVLIVALAWTAACTARDSTTPAEPSGPLVTETFTGTISAQGSAFHVFELTRVSTVYIVLTSAGPPSNISMGLAVGTPSGTPTNACTVLSSVTTAAGTTAQLSGTADPGQYCVQIYDVGNVSAPVAYRIAVVHS
jgi:hypothetical protein